MAKKKNDLVKGVKKIKKKPAKPDDKKKPGGGTSTIAQEERKKLNDEIQEIEIQKGDAIYLFSDGYADQFGGPRQKKFMQAN